MADCKSLRIADKEVLDVKRGLKKPRNVVTDPAPLIKKLG